MRDIYSEISRVEDKLNKIINREIAALEETIGLHIDPIIDDRRSYASDYYRIKMKLNHTIYAPSEHTRQYVPKGRK